MNKKHVRFQELSVEQCSIPQNIERHHLFQAFFSFADDSGDKRGDEGRQVFECKDSPYKHWPIKGKWSLRLQTPFSLLSKADSNHHKQNQNLLCYHYTIGQFRFHKI